MHNHAYIYFLHHNMTMNEQVPGLTMDVLRDTIYGIRISGILATEENMSTIFSAFLLAANVRER